MKKNNATIKDLSQTARLVLLAREGKDNALNELCARIEKRLFRFSLFLTGERELAKDLTQEIYIKVLENIQTLEQPEAFVPWLFKVTKNKFLDYVGSAHYTRCAATENAGEHLASLSGKTELGMQLAQSLEKLHPEDRYLLLLSSLEGLTYQETGDIMGMTAESIRCKLYRLRKLIRSDIHTMDFAA